MKKFIKSLFLFIVFFLFIILTPLLFTNKYYGNKRYDLKHSYLKNKKKNKINTLFFGSSRVYRQINPKILDSLLINKSIHSFNLGAPSTFYPELFFLYENFLYEHKKNSIKYVIIELGELNQISHFNIKTNQASYWINLENLIFSIKYNIYESQFNFKKKIEVNYNYVSCFLFKIFNLKKYDILLKTKANSNLTFLGKDLNGYYSLEQEMDDIAGLNGYRKRHNFFLLNSKQSKIRLNSNKPKTQLNKILLKKILDLIKISKNKKIHLIYLIPPKVTNYKKLNLYKQKIPKNNIIDLYNQKKYPLLYNNKYSFDSGHLNSKGAEFLTKYLSIEFQKIIDKSTKK